MQTAVQVLHTLNDILHLILILGLDLAGLANSEVEVQLDGALAVREPASGRGIGVGHEADLVLACIGSGEGEAAGVAVALADDAVVIVEGLVDCDLDLQGVVDVVGVGVRVDDVGGEGACLSKCQLVNSQP